MSLTLLLVIATSAISVYAWQNRELTNKWIFNPYSVYKYNQYYRFITSGFLHSGWIHLFFNMFVLYMFGQRIEGVFSTIYGATSGKIIFGGLYLLGIIISDIPTFLKHKNAAYYNALGASGGVSSVLFSYVLFFPIEKLYLYALIGLPGIVWAALYVVYSIYMGKQGSDNINHDAHLYGGIFGLVYTIIVYPSVVPRFLEQLTQLSIF